MTRTGQCLCGAVSFTAKGVPATISICHCEMCRRWTGSALVGVTLPEENVVWKGKGHIATRQTTSWAERGWCGECGSGMWFRVTADTPYKGEIEIPLGVFDDPNGFTVSSEIYIDHKPDSFAFEANDRKVLTRQDCVERFSLLDGE
jgi:hypothetical protein